ncbi:hypothetical protein GCM10027570_43050 [Streptomonospora sediminis]
MGLGRRDEARLHGIQRRLAADDPDWCRRLRNGSARLAEHGRSAGAEPVPWAGVLLVWAAVLAAALLLISATAAGV